ncbi:hypothetical protein [Arcobacter sp. LA11]|uniref:YkvI family membrane protein n=1 Tax=Arcobacter sp. LA11 TaxID=1898176 RepID=UPI0009327C0E|nr:hypothetical protein [Arcobacter sp. LA11]
MNNSSINIKLIIITAGTLCSYLIGAGFSTGQELLQFYSSYGLSGYIGLALGALFFLYCANAVYTASKTETFNNPYEGYHYFAGKVIGTFYEWYNTIIFYAIYVIMVAGAGAATEQYFGVNPTFGGIAVAILMMVTVLMGLDKLMNILGFIGPVMIIFAISIGLVSIFSNVGAIAHIQEHVHLIEDSQPYSHFITSGIAYMGLCFIMSVPLMIATGSKLSSIKEAKIASVVGVLAYCAAAAMIVAAEHIYIQQVAGFQVPTLKIAEQFSPIFGMAFAVIIVIGLYTTGAGLLWSSVRKFAKDRTRKSYAITVVLSVIGVFFGGVLPFNELIGLILPPAGFVGAVFAIFIVYKQFFSKEVVNEQNVETT